MLRLPSSIMSLAAPRFACCAIRTVLALGATAPLAAGAQAGGAAPRAMASAAPPAADARFSTQDALGIVTYSVGDLSADGRWLVATSTVRRDGLGVDFTRDGDPTYIRPSNARVWIVDTRSGEKRALWPDARNVRSPQWSPDGSRLALLVLRGEAFEPVVWERASGKFATATVPAGRYVAENSELRWTADGKEVVFSLHTDAWRRKMREQFERQTRGPVFVQSSKDPFLAWDDTRRAGNLRSVVAYDVRSGRLRELIPEGMIGTFTLSKDARVVTYGEDITKKTDYDVIGGAENKLVTRMDSAAARTIIPTLKGVTLVWSEDGHRYAFGREGRVWTASVDDTARRLIAGPPDTARRGDAPPADTSREARERRDRERFTALRFSPRGDALLLSNRAGLWIADVATGTKEMFIATPDSSTLPPRVAVVGWTEDGARLYLSHASRTKWERGLLRYDRASKTTDTLVKDNRSYGAMRMSRDGSVAVIPIGTGNRPPDLYVADGDFRNLRRLVETNPQLASKRFGKTELLTYLDADGHGKYGVVYYPADYEPGKRYPTVFNIYEDFFDDTFDATINVLTANGYLVVRPSVDFDIGYPGEAWVKGVTSAANKLIDLGVADSSRLGVHGTSYGGYATNLLITQTPRFKAAINISGKVDVISFYTDSPRLGVRNVHAAEKSQDRIGATLWQQPQKYVQHSAIFFADRIQTPLMLITGEQDSNVPAGNTREMYYALRRLGKEVTWVNYMNGGHGGGNASVADFLDMHQRILGWYDTHLKRDPSKKVAEDR